MDNDSSPLGFSEVPPISKGDGESAKKEQKSYPLPDRPVYTVPPEPERKSESDSFGISGILSITGVLLGIMAIASVMALSYKMSTGVRQTEERVTKVSQTVGKMSQAVGEVSSAVGEVSNAVGEMKLVGNAMEVASLQIETTRTLHLLDALAEEYADDPEQIAKIDAMRENARAILNRAGEQAP